MKPNRERTPENVELERTFQQRDAMRYGVALVPCLGANDGAPCPDAIKVRDGAGWCNWCLPRTQVV